MFKYIFLIAFIYSNLLAQNFNGLKIYVNPGHGGHDSDDRYIAATGFWESESNLDKGLYLRELLIKYNANVRISRTTNNTSDDLGLSVIAADANNFDADFFHSIHSNGFQGTSNYTVILYKGNDSGPEFPEAKTMAGIMSNEIYQVNRTTAKYSRADYSFLGYYLGVLRTLNMPGTLSEGSFHDYIPESWRLKNTFYHKHEAWGILRSFINYFNLESLQTGIVAGILRDPFENVSYYSISGTKDGLKPVNDFTVELLGANKIYRGDNYNNGFFMFDDLEEGDYSLAIKSTNYGSDTISVSTHSNRSSFYDHYLYFNPDLSPPYISFSSINNGADKVSLITPIKLIFSNIMDISSVENAFSITPQISGQFEWLANDSELLFTPISMFNAGVNYTVQIGPSAKSYFGTAISDEFKLNFTTRSKLELQEIYPLNLLKDVSTTVLIILDFDAGLDATSLAGNISFEDEDNNFVSILVDQSRYSEGIVSFEPINPLTLESNYSIKILSGVKDVEGLSFGEDIEIKFTTESSNTFEGNILDNFEGDLNWLNPSNSLNSFGLNPVNTNFIKTSKRFHDGLYSGKLAYEFNSDSGACNILNSSQNQISSLSTLGIWIFGDNSNNGLEYWLVSPEQDTIKSNSGNIDWTGWKFKFVEFTEGLQNYKLNSIVVTHGQSGKSSGEIYFDEILFDLSSTIENGDLTSPHFTVHPNYPNPFNPSTQISFEIPEQNLVTIDIFSITGEKISSLINNKSLNAGKHKIRWNGRNNFGYDVPSGVYICRLISGKSSKSFKMMLIR